MRYLEFGRGTGLRVSELALGGALFGTTWGYGAEANVVAELLDAYGTAGGNFIDTADFYQHGQSEMILGDALQGRRDDFVLATKYGLGSGGEAALLTSGANRLNMVRSLEASLRRLKTDRIDLFWAHMPDPLTSVDEVMRGLEDLVRAGKILYAGLSDFPAWRAARAATLAELRGWSPLVGMQFEYSLVERSAERDLLPMAAAFGLGVTAWSPLGGGLLSGKYRRGEPGRATTFGGVIHHEDTPAKTAVLDALLAVAAEIDRSPSQVALAWLSGRGAIPVIGPRTVAQLQDNIGAAGLVLDAGHRRRLNAAAAPILGFPHDFLAHPAQADRLAGGNPETLVLGPQSPR